MSHCDRIAVSILLIVGGLTLLVHNYSARARTIISDSVLEGPPVLVGHVLPSQPAVVWLESGGKNGDLNEPQNVLINCDEDRARPISEGRLHVAQVLDHIEFHNCGPEFDRAQYLSEQKVPLSIIDTWDVPWLYVVESRFYTIADTEGRFVIPNVPEGIYMLHARSPFNGHVRLGIAVPSPEYVVDFVMDRSYLTYLDETTGERTALAPIR